MKYGCCVNLLPKREAKTGIEYAGRLKALGYDYVELPLNELSKLSEPEFEALLQRLEEAGLPCLCCNDFMPASFQITGPRLTPREELSNYLRLAMGRLRRLGASYTVFGSPWSRSCPEGFPRERAFGQIADFLGMAGDEAARNGIVIAVEHNNRSETNMLNHFPTWSRWSARWATPMSGRCATTTTSGMRGTRRTCCWRAGTCWSTPTSPSWKTGAISPT